MCSDYQLLADEIQDARTALDTEVEHRTVAEQYDKDAGKAKADHRPAAALVAYTAAAAAYTAAVVALQPLIDREQVTTLAQQKQSQARLRRAENQQNIDKAAAAAVDCRQILDRAQECANTARRLQNEDEYWQAQQWALAAQKQDRENATAGAVLADPRVTAAAAAPAPHLPDPQRKYQWLISGGRLMLIGAVLGLLILWLLAASN